MAERRVEFADSNGGKLEDSVKFADVSEDEYEPDPMADLAAGLQDTGVEGLKKKAPAKQPKARSSLGDEIRRKRIEDSWENAKTKRKVQEAKAVKKTVQAIGKTLEKTAVVDDLPEDTPANRSDLLRQILQYRESPFFCTPIVQRVAMETPLKVLVREVRSCENELAERRGRTIIAKMPEKLVFGVAQASRMAKQMGVKLPVDVSTADKRYAVKAKSPEFQLILDELSVRWGGYAKMSAEMALAYWMFELFAEDAKENAVGAPGGAAMSAEELQAEMDKHPDL